MGQYRVNDHPYHTPQFTLTWAMLNDQTVKSSLLALVGDFFIDVYFLHGLSTDTLIDVKNIHFEKGALIAMVFFEFTGKGSLYLRPKVIDVVGEIEQLESFMVERPIRN